MNSPVPHPELNGSLRVEMQGSNEVYFIDRGLRRLIPYHAEDTTDVTRLNLFLPTTQIIVDPNLAEIEEGTPLTYGAVLARPLALAPVYLIDQGVKRHVASPNIMQAYQFNWDTVLRFPQFLIDLIPDGPEIAS